MGGGERKIDIAEGRAGTYREVGDLLRVGGIGPFGGGGRGLVGITTLVDDRVAAIGIGFLGRDTVIEAGAVKRAVGESAVGECGHSRRGRADLLIDTGVGGERVGVGASGGPAPAGIGTEDIVRDIVGVFSPGRPPAQCDGAGVGVVDNQLGGESGGRMDLVGEGNGAGCIIFINISSVPGDVIITPIIAFDKHSPIEVVAINNRPGIIKPVHHFLFRVC